MYVYATESYCSLSAVPVVPSFPPAPTPTKKKRIEKNPTGQIKVEVPVFICIYICVCVCVSLSLCIHIIHLQMKKAISISSSRGEILHRRPGPTSLGGVPCGTRKKCVFHIYPTLLHLKRHNGKQ